MIKFSGPNCLVEYDYKFTIDGKIKQKISNENERERETEGETECVL